MKRKFYLFLKFVETNKPYRGYIYIYLVNEQIIICPNSFCQAVYSL